MTEMELTIVMPCLNERVTLENCITKAKRFLASSNVSGEILIADNGSTDGSQKIAEGLGARVVSIEKKGYGSALLGGIEAAKGKFIIMGDADDSYDFSSCGPMLQKLREGFDLVMGNRFQGGIRPRAMPFLHRYLGNPVLSFIGNVFFHSAAHDFHCGLRGFRTEAIRNLQLKTTGMEFASEMIVKAVLQHLRITEVPTILYPDGRDRRPHLRTWHDGWRHLRFLLLFSPRWLFLYPGIVLVLIGLALGLWLLPGQQYVFDVHTLLYCFLSVILGLNAISFSLFSRVYAAHAGLIPPDAITRRFTKPSILETGIIVGSLLLLVGIGISVAAVTVWEQAGFGALDPAHMLRIVIPSVTLIFIGFHIILSSFFLSILNIERF